LLDLVELVGDAALAVGEGVAPDAMAIDMGASHTLHYERNEDGTALEARRLVSSAGPDEHSVVESWALPRGLMVGGR
jgi:hypothetical protein